MNDNNMKTQIYHKTKYDLKGHPRSYKIFFYAQIILAWTDFDANLYEC